MASTRPRPFASHSPPQARRFNAISSLPEIPVTPGVPLDPYYGNQEIAALCAKFIKHAFMCSEILPQSPSAMMPPTLTSFIAHAIYRTQFKTNVAFFALNLIMRLKLLHPTTPAHSGHALFLTAYLIASEVVHCRTYSSDLWVTIGQNLFSTPHIDRMEQEFRKRLHSVLTIIPGKLREFENKVRSDFAGPGPYPGFVQLRHRLPCPPGETNRPATIQNTISLSAYHRRIAHPSDSLYPNLLDDHATLPHLVTPHEGETDVLYWDGHFYYALSESVRGFEGVPVTISTIAVPASVHVTNPLPPIVVAPPTKKSAAPKQACDPNRIPSGVRVCSVPIGW